MSSISYIILLESGDSMWGVIELIFTLIEATTKVYFLTHFFQFKKDKPINKLVFVLATLTECAIVTLFNQFAFFDGLIGGMLYMLISFAFCMAFLRGKAWYKLMVCCCVEISMVLISYFTIFVLTMVSGKSFLDLITEQEIWRLVCLLLAKFLFMFIVAVALRIKNNDKIYFSKYEWSIIISVFLCSFLIALGMFELTIKMPNTIETNGVVIIILCGLIIINIAAVILTIRMAKENDKKIKVDLLKLQLKQQTKSIMEINSKYDNIVKIRHDFKNYIACAAALINDGCYIEAKKYLEELGEKKIPKAGMYIHTTNYILNALLNSKFTLCSEKNIDTKCHISGTIEKIADIDFSILMANLLDNAIEACANIEKPLISVEIYDKKNYIGIIVGNTIKDSVLSKNANLNTTKSDNENHGIGILSVKDIVKTHNGMIDFYEKDNMFFCSLLLEQNMNVLQTV